MQQHTAIIQNPTGLHARPARLFVDTAKRYGSDIRVKYGPKTVNGKSLISLLGLGAGYGSELMISADGSDEHAALTALTELIAHGMGEPTNGVAHVVPAMTAAANPATPESNTQLRGIAAAPGHAIGPVLHVLPVAHGVAAAAKSLPEERAQLAKARVQARTQLDVLMQQLVLADAKDEAEIFKAHLEILDDADWLDDMDACLQQAQSAADAIQAVANTRSAQLRGLADATLAARAIDVQDVAARLIACLTGESHALALPAFGVILLADELPPSLIAGLDPQRVLGICTASGGPTAHASIIARALGIPAVVGAGPRVLRMLDGEILALDGNSGELHIKPNAVDLAAALAKRDAWLAARARNADAAHAPAVTLDGRHIEVAGNAGGAADAQRARDAGADGIGLLRSELMFFDSPSEPSEQAQFEAYASVVVALDGRPVIVRTLDVGGDKPLPYVKMPAERNPFLGERGIRLCLNQPDLFERQLRAILRAAAGGRLRVMFPMITSMTEWRRAKAMLERVRAELGVAAVETGIMIEVPAAALLAHVFAREVDFFSIGTNDLTQYTLAIDREHPVLASQADALHPAVLQLISLTVQAAHSAGKWVSVCGEAGSDAQAVPILIGLGVDELSANPPAIAGIKAQIRGLNYAATQTLAQAALACETAADVRALLV